MKHSVRVIFAETFLCVEVSGKSFLQYSIVVHVEVSLLPGIVCVFLFLPGWGVGSLYNLFINAYPKYAGMTVAEQARTGPNCSVLC